jgi:hypothetical protein
MFIEITFDTILVNQFYFWNHLIDLLRNQKPFSYQYTENPKNENVIENFIKFIFGADELLYIKIIHTSMLWQIV